MDGNVDHYIKWDEPNLERQILPSFVH
jgi:hypothetical protein